MFDLRSFTPDAHAQVHFISDEGRGAVWEETLMHLPPSVQYADTAPTEWRRGGGGVIHTRTHTDTAH